MTPALQRCEHYHVCWFQHTRHKCINDNPKDIPCIFDTRKSIDFTECTSHSSYQSERDKVLDEYDVKEHRNWYNPLEHLELEFTKMIDAVEETAIDGQLTQENHTKYEMCCLCRGRVKRKIEELRQGGE